MIQPCRLQLSQILLILMMTIGVTQATLRESLFNKVDEHQSIVGKIGVEMKATSEQECAIW